MSQPYLLYCQNNSVQNLNNLERLFVLLDQAKVAAQGVWETPLNYAGLILNALQDVSQKSLADAYATQMLGFIDTPLLEKIVSEPTQATEAELKEIGAQFLYVAVALGGIEEIEPYSPEELAKALDGGEVTFHESFVIVTLGYVILNPEAGYMPLLMRMVSQNYEANLMAPYEWLDVFLEALIMHAAWRYFPALAERDRQYLLQRYFYRAVVSNIPVRDWLTMAYPAGLSSPDVNAIFQPLLASLEMIPTNIELSASRKFGDVMKEYIAMISREQISTLAQEQYLNKWYVNTPTGQLFRSWLRESLGIVYRIQTNTLK